MDRYYHYVSKIDYDKVEQLEYLKYCNGAETFYTYDPQRRRLQNLVVTSSAGTIMDNAYSYDDVSNVLSIADADMNRTASCQVMTTELFTVVAYNP